MTRAYKDQALTMDIPKPRRGYFAIGIENFHKDVNVGTLWRTAHIYGCDFIFTVGRKYTNQSSDTTLAYRSVPLFHFDTFDALLAARPKEAMLIGIEMDERARPIENFVHPERAIYLLGSERTGLCKDRLDQCDLTVRLPGAMSVNVAVAGSIVIFDRAMKLIKG